MDPKEAKNSDTEKKIRKKTQKDSVSQNLRKDVS